MKINITAGAELTKLLAEIYPNEVFIPFNEAMIKGTYSSPLFSEEFVKERASTHGVTLESYKETMKNFLSLIKNLNQYDSITLWFGDEPFCKANTKVVIDTLTQFGYNKELILNIVDEITCQIISSKQIKTR